MYLARRTEDLSIYIFYPCFNLAEESTRPKAHCTLYIVRKKYFKCGFAFLKKDSCYE